MEFSTKVIDTMAKIMAEEMEKMMLAPENIRTVETGMRELLRKVGAEALSQYLEQADEAEPLEKEKECECQGKQEYLFRREAVILSVFGRVRYKQRYYTCRSCGKGQSPLDGKMRIAAGEVTAGLAELLALAGVESSFAESSRFIEHKRMNYALFRQQGYFIGSGTVESAGKQIAGIRLKRAGARWTETGAVAIAKARAAWLSDDWDELAVPRASLPLAA